MKHLTRALCLLLVLVTMCSMVVPAVNAASDQLVDVTSKFAGKSITIRSVENGQYLCADSSASGTPLRANKTNAAVWETFQVSAMTKDGWVGLKAHTGKWLSAMADTKNAPINAHYDKLKSWECFRIYQKDGNYYIKAQANNKWLCVRVDSKNAPVQAYADAPSTWERLDIRFVPVDVTAKFAGKIVTIRSLQNGKYLCADSSADGTPLLANKNNAILWETFQVSNLTADGWVGITTHTGKWLSAMADTTDTPINARYDNLLDWESFRIYQVGDAFCMKAKTNGKWLCVRVDTDQAPVQAYASTPSTWERLDIQLAAPVDVTAEFAGNSITIRSRENSKYLCADSSISGTPLCANKTNAAVWETFVVSQMTADGWVGIMAHTGDWLSVLADTTNTPIKAAFDIANYDRILDWESFRIYQAGANYYMKAKSNGKWLCVRVDTDQAPVQAYASDPLTWEQLDIQIQEFAPVWPCEKSHHISTLYRYWNNGNVKNHGTKSNMYNAIDITGGGSGDQIYAIEAGKVVEKGTSSSLGNYITLEHSNGLRSQYAHMKSASTLNKGDYVTRGQTIGYMGSTGNSTGPHLHLDVYDPNNLKRVINPWVTWYQGNISVTVGGNSYRANSKYPNDTAAKAWCSWLTESCTKNSSGNYVFTS